MTKILEENCLSIHDPAVYENIRESLVAEDFAPKSYCNWGNNSLKAIFALPSYEVKNYKAVFVSLFKDDKGTFNTPKMNVSQFEGCPHFYGKIYWRGGIYELQQEITEEFLKKGKATGGDWEGYKVGEYTQRFLSRESLNEAFNKIKEKMV